MVRKVNPNTDAKQITDIYNIYILNTTVSFETEPLTVAQMEQRISQISTYYPYFVWEEENKILGYAYVHQWKERAAYRDTVETTIYLAPNSKNKGIGTMLMKQLINECKAQNYRMLIACITGDNIASIEFHKKIGFTEVSHFHNVGKKFGRWLDVVDMEFDTFKTKI